MSTSEPPADEPTSDEPSAGGFAAEEPTSAGAPAEEPTTAGAPAEEPTTAGAPAEEPTSEEPTAEDPTAKEPTPKEPTAEEPTATGPTAEEQPTEVAAAAPPSAEPAPHKISRKRLIGVDVLIAVTTILAIVGMVAIWANRLLLNPTNWENTSTQLLADPDIRSATANYIVDQIYANVNVAGLISSALPPRLDPLAGPAAGALQNVAVQGVELALSRPRVQSLWATANRAADQALVAVVEGGKGPVGVKQGVVTLNLASIVDDIAARLGLPANLGAKLPPDIGTLTVLKSNQIKLVQNIGNAIKGLALWLTILVPLLYLLAIFLARGHRRRTLMTVGFSIVLAGLIGIAVRHLLINGITNSLVMDEATRPAVRATIGIGTQILAQIASAFILVGAVAVFAAWFAGPSRLWTGVRWALAPYMRDNAVPTYATVTGIMVLIFIWNPIPATGTPAGIIAFLALALFGTEMLRRQTAEEFPDAQRGDAVRALREWRERRRERHHPRTIAGAAPVTMLEQLERLSSLRDKGAITPDEYSEAKARVLSS
jgi:hypothetical protein